MGKVSLESCLRRGRCRKTGEASAAIATNAPEGSDGQPRPKPPQHIADQRAGLSKLSEKKADEPH